LLHSLT